VLCLAPGLFRSLKRGERKTSKLDVIYEYGDGQRIEFSGPEPLGADDLRILQGLVAMAGPYGLVLSPEPKTEGGQQLRLFLEPKWDSVQHDALVVKGSYRALAREIGYADIDNTRPIRDCIERLWKVSIIAHIGKRRQGFRLLAEYASDDTDGKLYVALNPRIAQAILGNAPHARISMDEVRALKSDAARLMHQRLCAWIDLGKSGRATLDTLCGYVWLEGAGDATMRKRRERARAALEELRGLVGWTITEYAARKFEINRRKSSPCFSVTNALRNCHELPV
jgi:Replication protein C (RepC)